MARRPVVKRAKASGVNIPEAQRGTVQVKLRLPDDVAEDLDALATHWNLTRSGAVAQLVEGALTLDLRKTRRSRTTSASPGEKP